MDWPISIDDMKPYYTKAENAIGSTHRGGRAPLPANNNYKVFANGAKNVGYKFYATGPYGTNAEPYDGRPGSIQDGFNFQGDKNGSKWSTAKREIPRALETGLLDLRTNAHVVKITHDKNKKLLIYDDALLKVYNVPILYFPKFFHPDPTVKRQSGLLQPRLNNSNTLGSSINIPYYHVISDNKDFTIRPTIFDKDVKMFQNEYRQVNEKSSLLLALFY